MATNLKTSLKTALEKNSLNLLNGIADTLKANPRIAAANDRIRAKRSILNSLTVETREEKVTNSLLDILMPERVEAREAEKAASKAAKAVAKAASKSASKSA